MEPGAIVFAGVRAGMEPFRCETISISYERDLDYRRYIFKLRVDSLPDDVFVYKVEDDAFIRSYNPIHVFEEIRVAAFHFFRTLYVPPDDHVELGEN